MGRRRRVTAAVAVVATGIAALLTAAYLPGSPLSSLRVGTLIHGASRNGSGDASAPADSDGVEPTDTGTPTSSPSPSQTTVAPAPSGSLRLRPAKVTISASGYWSWALLDLKTGEITGSANPTTTSDTASMIKSWIASDYLRRAAEKKQTPNATIMAELSTMIRDSDNTHAYEFHIANGNLSSIKRMISMCKLTDTKGTQNSWSLTQMSTRDITRLAACIANGTAAGPKWTAWLLNEMRNVRGAGRFGVIQALPAAAAATTAIKNGWLLRDSDHLWHISCLAVGDGWALGVHARYPNSLGKDYGAKICRSVGEQLIAV